jgi:lambda family phage tail tape measure protein
MQKEIGREVASFGMGREERRSQSARGQINDKYDRDSLRVQEEMAARRRIQNGRLTDEQERFFQGELSMIEGYRDKAVKAYEEGFSRMKEAQADWRIGASVSIKDYFNDATNAAQNTAEVFQKSFSAMEDALTKFVTTGKLDWKNLGDSIAQEITRMVIRWQIGQAMMAVSGPGGDPSAALINLGMSLFGGGGAAPAASGGLSAYSLSSGSPVSNIGLKMRAYGGPVEAGQMYQVNERGPELLSYGGRHFLMMGAQNGQVSPASSQPSGSAQPMTNITVNVTPPSGSSRETASQWGAAAGRPPDGPGRPVR